MISCATKPELKLHSDLSCHRGREGAQHCLRNVKSACAIPIIFEYLQFLHGRWPFQLSCPAAHAAERLRSSRASSAGCVVHRRFLVSTFCSSANGVVNQTSTITFKVLVGSYLGLHQCACRALEGQATYPLQPNSAGTLRHLELLEKEHGAHTFQHNLTLYIRCHVSWWSSA